MFYKAKKNCYDSVWIIYIYCFIYLFDKPTLAIKFNIPFLCNLYT